MCFHTVEYSITEVILTIKESRMRAYVRYWLFTVLLIVLVLMGWQYGFFAWAYERFSEPKILVASIFLLCIFLWAYIVIGYKAALQLYRDDQHLRYLEECLIHSPEDGVATARRILDEFYARRNERAVKNSTVCRFVASLAERIRVTRKVKTFEPVNRSMFQDYFEAELTRNLAILEKFQWVLFNVGFLGTLVGIILALAVQSIPANVEQIREFSFGILSGAGLAYTTSALGIGGGHILFGLHGSIDEGATDIAFRFRTKMFEAVFPVIHSEEFGYKDNELKEVEYGAEKK